jgi:hypothetical protein
MLPNLFGAECTNAVQPKTENDPIFFPQPDVESRELRGKGTAVPSLSERNC